MTADILWLLVTLFVGAFLGSLLAYDWGYRDGRRQERLWIERASGMYDPVCTCVSTPGECVYHGDLTKERVCTCIGERPEVTCPIHSALGKVADYYEAQQKRNH